MNKYNPSTSAEHLLEMKIYAGLQGNLKKYRIKSLYDNNSTEFEPPLDLAREKIGTDKLYERADIILVTDGESAVREDWLKKYKAWKNENKVNIYTVLIDSYDNSIATVRKFSDRVDKLSNLRDSDNNDSVALEIFLDI